MPVDWSLSRGESPMSLQYENYGLRRIVVEANLWPPIEDVSQGALSQLFGNLNGGDDMFSACELKPNGASFQGDLWTYDYSGSTVRIRCFGFGTYEELYRRIRKLLDGTRSLAIDGTVGFFSEEIRVFADVPEGGSRDVGEVVKKKLLRGMKEEDREALPGLDGAGLTLDGKTESFSWRANIDPKADSLLSLFVGLSFYPDPEPPRPGSDLDLTEHQVKVACSFVEKDLLTFSSKLFT
jgi:hypothetical protein